LVVSKTPVGCIMISPDEATADFELLGGVLANLVAHFSASKV
jgi:hypothetical protein